MDLRQSYEHAPRWERRLYELTGSDPESFDDAIGRFDEFDEDQRSPRTDLDLVVLLGEAGLLERAAGIIETLGGTEGEGAQYSHWLEAAYLDAPSSEEATALSDEIRRELPGDWFTDTLVRRIASRVDDQELQARAESAIEARGRSMLTRVRALTGTGAALLVLAAVVALRLRSFRAGPAGGRRAAAPALARRRRDRPLLPGRVRLPADPGRGGAPGAARAPGHRDHGAGGRPADALVGAALSARARA